MSALKQAVLKLVKDGVVFQNKIKVSIPGKSQAEVLNALTELVNEGELSVTQNRARGNVYAINFRQPLPPLEEGVPAVQPETDSFPEKEPITDEVPAPPTPEELAEFKKLADAAETAKTAVVSPVGDVHAPLIDNTASDGAPDGLKGSKPNPVEPGRKASNIKK